MVTMTMFLAGDDLRAADGTAVKVQLTEPRQIARREHHAGTTGVDALRISQPGANRDLERGKEVFLGKIICRHARSASEDA